MPLTADHIANLPAISTHITSLQDTIKRVADNSAACKTWCLTLVAASLSLVGGLHVKEMATAALIPIVVFGFLDTMYLAQEKAYRRLYNAVVALIQDGSYDAGNLFHMKAPASFDDFRSALCSWSVFPIYLGLVAAYIAAELSGWFEALAGRA